MNNIHCLSRLEFKNELHGITEHQFDSTAFISIHSPKIGLHFNDTEVILEDAPNVLNLWFHDIDPESEVEWLLDNPDHVEVAFDEIMALQIKEFLLRNKRKLNWMIHCTAGICRSGAVGEVINDYFQQNFLGFKRDNPQINPNVWVKKVLRKTLGLHAQ